MMGTFALPPKLPLGHGSSAWIQSRGRCHQSALQTPPAAWGHPGAHPSLAAAPGSAPGKETLSASKRPAHSLLPSGVRAAPGARASRGVAAPGPVPGEGSGACLPELTCLRGAGIWAQASR